MTDAEVEGDFASAVAGSEIDSTGLTFKLKRAGVEETLESAPTLTSPEDGKFGEAGVEQEIVWTYEDEESSESIEFRKTVTPTEAGE